MPSNGLHTNGYSLVRKIFFDVHKFSVDKYFDELNSTLSEELLRVHESYQQAINSLKNEPFLHGMSHITGGGIEGNTKRVLSENLNLNINWDSWNRLPIFSLIAKHGNVAEDEMRRVFNLGIGFIFIIDKDSVDNAINILKNKQQKPIVIGEVR